MAKTFVMVDSVVEMIALKIDISIVDMDCLSTCSFCFYLHLACPCSRSFSAL